MGRCSLVDWGELHFQMPHGIMPTVSAAVLPDIDITFDSESCFTHFFCQLDCLCILTIVWLGIIFLRSSTSREFLSRHNGNNTARSDWLVIEGESRTPTVSNMIVGSYADGGRYAAALRSNGNADRICTLDTVGCGCGNGCITKRNGLHNALR